MMACISTLEKKGKKGGRKEKEKEKEQEKERKRKGDETRGD